MTESLRGAIARWKRWVQRVKLDVVALFLAYQDARTPWYAKFVALCVVAYAVSPIDLIPDPIPVLGYLDDLLLLPLGILLAIRLIPAPVLDECRAHAAAGAGTPTSLRRAGVVVILLIWLAVAVFALYFMLR